MSLFARILGGEPRTSDSGSPKAPFGSANVYQVDDVLLVGALDRVPDGFWISSDAILSLKASSTSAADLGRTVLDVLTACRDGVTPPTKDEASAWSKRFLRLARAKSRADLMRRSLMCTIDYLEDGSLSFEPTSNGGPTGENRGFHSQAEHSLRLSPGFSPDQVGVAVRSALHSSAATYR
jgi:hypothetical protein